jgi:ATP-dependent DNA helicase RecG
MAAERLKVFRSTSDGFAIAHADLRIRGQGDLFGEAQSGRDPILRFADLLRDEDLLYRAQTMARGVVDLDPELEHPRNARIRSLLDTRWADRLRLFQVG